jgi:hypothetical protein
MVRASHSLEMSENRVKIYRLYYYIALTQLLLYFIVPMVIFPGRIIKDVQVISALTLGPLVGLFFFLVNITGLFLDRGRRTLYIVSISIIVIYFAGTLLAWAYIEHLDFLLR